VSDDLIARLGDENVNERKKALARLVQERASGPLVRALDSDDAEIRAQAARGLSEIADPATAERLAAATEDEQAEVRAFAAVGLARIGDPRAVDALVKTIDELQDPLHYPYTAAVYALEAIGEPAVPAVVGLLNADDPNTRRRAQVVLSSAVPGSEGWDDAQWADYVSSHGP
jgi:HEAT repeat protein